MNKSINNTDIYKLTIEEVEGIALRAESQERIPAYALLSANIKHLARQLADTMRDNELLLATLNYIAVGEDTVVEDLIAQYQSNKDTDNG